MPTVPSSPKSVLRRQLFDARAQRNPVSNEEANLAIQQHCLQLLADNSFRRVAAYIPVGTEPGGSDFAEVLRTAGVEVLVPRCLPQRQLEWAAYLSPDSLRLASFNLLEPTGSAIPDGLAGCDLIFVPALAVTREGYRLGKGGGFYDIALSQLPAPIPTASIVFDEEVLPTLPLEPHDAQCDAIISPAGILHVSGSI
ncbi:5-formyltetrahydrofolate cyclo-ligase [Corynebacterium epidermidicanis]|nr:5-formyltetrahydrofolate cyclo-ligase [Corynebacterium epidermidicanis]